MFERLTRDPRALLPALGAMVVLATTALASLGSLLAIPFALWSLVPWAVLFALGRTSLGAWPLAGAGVAALSAEIGLRASVFVWPRGSTAGIVLVFSPALILLVVTPAGAALGWLAGRAWCRHALGRAAVLVLAPAIAGLTLLGFARPDLFPTTVLRRRALLERIGPPRVVAGADAFASTPVADRPQWLMTAELDGVPGEELALVDHAGARLIEPRTLQPLRTLAFPQRRGGFWTSFAALVRLPDDEIAVAETGGGFSRTLVRRLDGSTLWEYRPDGDSSPSSLDPADLDGDGRVEFYASSLHRIARLDAGGRVVWHQPARLPDLAVLLPPTARHPAWVVGVEYASRALVFDAAGTPLGTVPTEQGVMTTAADLGDERLVFLGDARVRGFALDGRLRVEIPLGDFRASQIFGARLSDDGPASLVVVAAVPELKFAPAVPELKFGPTVPELKFGPTYREGRYRLLIVDAGRRTLYDEITDVYPRVLVARGTASDVVFVATGAPLRRLAPLAPAAR
jgi:hypothetical protein